MTGIQLRVLTGELAGTVRTYGSIPVSVGRGLESSLRFHATGDLAVSARHALLVPEADGWWVHDLDSRNGTWLNGRRIDAPTRLADGDRLTFGDGGPDVEVRLGGEVVTPATAERPVWRRRGVVGGVSVGVVGVLLAIILLLVTAGERTRAAWERERAALVSRLDSVLLVGELTARSLEGEREELASALRDAQENLRRARTELEGAVARGDAGRVEALQQELQARTAALERQRLAASLDFDDIERGSRRSVALVWVETEAGAVQTATAFAVRPDGTLLGAGHPLLGADGTASARRIGVQFSDSEQVFPAHILAVDAERDLAVLKVENVLGGVPVVRGLNPRGDTLGPGSPVAVMGFPLGGAPTGAAAPRAARPLVSSGVIGAWDADRVEILGYGAAGASGSPVFDADGRVVAVLFGGYTGADGHRILAVPAADALRLLERVR